MPTNTANTYTSHFPDQLYFDPGKFVHSSRLPVTGNHKWALIFLFICHLQFRGRLQSFLSRRVALVL